MRDSRLYQGVYRPHLVAHALSRNLDRPVVIDANSGSVMNAGQLRDETSRFVQALEEIGAVDGRVVAMLIGNRVEALHVSNACLFTGACFVPFHTKASTDDFLYMIEDSDVYALVYDETQFQGQIDAIAAQGTCVKHFVALGDAPNAVNLGELVAARAPQPLVAPTLTGDEVFRLAYSGGTTGRPKAIMNDHHMTRALAGIQLSDWEWPREVRQLICTPLSHAGSSVLVPTLQLDGSMIILPEFDPLRVLECIQEHRITCMLLVPTMIYALIDHPRLGEFDLSSLETVFYTAAAISPVRLQEAIRKLGPIFSQLYGQSEAPMTVTILRKAEHNVDDLKRLGSCGRPVPWVHVALLDSEGREVPDGEPGEICVRGPLVMPGYLNKPEQTAEAFAHGWLHTGDVAVRDADGYLSIVDRAKDMIITGGFNVYPKEIENVVESHASVLACSVFGVPHERWGEAVTAAIVARPGHQVDREEIAALVRDRKGAIHTPKQIHIVETLPLTALGKVDKKALRAAYGEAVASKTPA